METVQLERPQSSKGYLIVLLRQDWSVISRCDNDALEKEIRLTAALLYDARTARECTVWLAMPPETSSVVAETYLVFQGRKDDRIARLLARFRMSAEGHEVNEVPESAIPVVRLLGDGTVLRLVSMADCRAGTAESIRIDSIRFRWHYHPCFVGGDSAGALPGSEESGLTMYGTKGKYCFIVENHAQDINVRVTLEFDEPAAACDEALLLRVIDDWYDHGLERGFRGFYLHFMERTKREDGKVWVLNIDLGSAGHGSLSRLWTGLETVCRDSAVKLKRVTVD